MDSTAPSTNQVDMDEILSSIKSGVEEEAAKVGESADLIDAAAAQDAPVAEDEVLELSADEMVPETPADDVVDLAAFAQSGEAKMTPAPTQSMAELAAEMLGGALPAESEASAPAAPTEPTAGDEFDRLLAEISTEKEQKIAEAEVKKQDLLTEEPLGDVDTLVAAAEAVAAPEPVVAPLDLSVAPLAGGGAPGFTLGLVEGEAGPQVAFPAEVLAMALRPMVQQWLSQNLPAVVERLVKDEIAKMTQN